MIIKKVYVITTLKAPLRKKRTPKNKDRKHVSAEPISTTKGAWT